MKPTASQKTFGLIVQQIECTAFTIAHAVSSIGWRVFVFAAPELNQRPANAIFRDKLLALPGVSVEMGFQPVDLDVLYFEVTRLSPRDRVKHYARRAQRLGVISHTIRPGALRNYLAQLKDIGGMARFVMRAKRFLYVDGFRPADLYSLLGPRGHVGFDVHSSFLLDSALREKMFALDWEPGTARPYRLNFMGTVGPEPRTRILQEVEAALRQGNATLAVSPEQREEVLWFVDKGVPRDQFCKVLTECDFTLCPQGWGRATHRVVEALVRGSIPILQEDELPLYDLDLLSGKNCVAVPPGRWAEAVTATLKMDSAAVAQMRITILRMREEYLSIDASSRRLCRRFGIEG